MIETPRYEVSRPIYSFEELANDYFEDERKFNLLKKLDFRTKIKQITILSVLQLICPFPFIIASYYTAKCFLYDILAGTTLLVSDIPQGLVYFIFIINGK